MEHLIKMEKPGSPDSQTLQQTAASVTPFSITDILTRMENRSPSDHLQRTPTTTPDLQHQQHHHHLNHHQYPLADLRSSPSSLGFRPVSVLKYSSSPSPMDLSKDSVHQEVSSSVEPSPTNPSSASSSLRSSSSDATREATASPEGYGGLLVGGGRRSRSLSPCSEMSMEEAEMESSDREDGGGATTQNTAADGKGETFNYLSTYNYCGYNIYIIIMQGQLLHVSNLPPLHHTVFLISHNSNKLCMHDH